MKKSLKMKKYLVLGILLIFLACKKGIEINFENKSLVNSEIQEKNFNKTNFKDRAEELIYIREYLKYKLPLILIEKAPDIVKEAQYELIAMGENPTLYEAALRTRSYEWEYQRCMFMIMESNYSFKEVKEQLEVDGKMVLRLSEADKK